MKKSILLSLTLLLNINLLVSFYDYNAEKIVEQIEQELTETKDNTLLDVAPDLEQSINKLDNYNPFNFEKSVLYKTAYFSNLLQMGLDLESKFPEISCTNLTDKHGNNYLHYATAINDIRLTTFIISKYPTMALSSNKYGCTALHVATVHGSYSCINKLIFNVPFIINFADKRLNTPAHYSFLLEDLKAAELFLNNHITNINLTNADKLSISNIAIMKHNPDLQDIIAIRLLKNMYERKFS